LNLKGAVSGIHFLQRGTRFVYNFFLNKAMSKRRKSFALQRKASIYNKTEGQKFVYFTAPKMPH